MPGKHFTRDFSGLGHASDTLQVQRTTVCQVNFTRVFSVLGHASDTLQVQRTTVCQVNTLLEFSLAWDMPLIHFRSRELLYAR